VCNKIKILNQDKDYDYQMRSILCVVHIMQVHVSPFTNSANGLWFPRTVFCGFRQNNGLNGENRIWNLQRFTTIDPPISVNHAELHQVLQPPDCYCPADWMPPLGPRSDICPPGQLPPPETTIADTCPWLWFRLLGLVFRVTVRFNRARLEIITVRVRVKIKVSVWN